MRKLTGLFVLAAVVLVFLLVVPSIRVARSQDKPKVDPMLTVCQDESTVEKAILEYLKVTKKITGLGSVYDDEEKTDLLVTCPIELDGLPPIRVVIDTLVAEKNDDGKVRERVIMVQSYYVLPASAKTAEARQKLLALNSAWMDDHWSPGGVYLDGDGDLNWRTAINIPGAGFSVHAELVFDAVARMAPFWKAYYPKLKKELNLPEAKKEQ